MSELNRFFYNGPLQENVIIELDEGSAKHIWQVLRMTDDEPVVITNGKGVEAIGLIKSVGRHSCEVLLKTISTFERQKTALHLAVAFTKNNGRNEWMLEKAAELGVASITPVEAARSEKVHFRSERWEKLLVSALLQSQQQFLPHLHELTPLAEVLKRYVNVPERFVAHCIAEKERQPLGRLLKPATEAAILIGPEGDFRSDEVSLCMSYGYKSVSLGAQRLRTETAAITACAFFNVVNDGQ